MNSFFPEYHPESKLWVFACKERLSAEQKLTLTEAIKGFCSNWCAHGQPLQADFIIAHDQFVLICVNASAENASGCSIDSLFKFVRSAGEQINNDLVVSSDVFFLEDSSLKMMSQPEFAEYIHTGKISDETIVFNNAISKLSQLRSGLWETNFTNSWHAKKFPLPTG